MPQMHANGDGWSKLISGLSSSSDKRVWWDECLLFELCCKRDRISLLCVSFLLFSVHESLVGKLEAPFQHWEMDYCTVKVDEDDSRHRLMNTSCQSRSDMNSSSSSVGRKERIIEILTVVDAFSSYAWAFEADRQSGEHVKSLSAVRSLKLFSCTSPRLCAFHSTHEIPPRRFIAGALRKAGVRLTLLTLSLSLSCSCSL